MKRKLRKPSKFHVSIDTPSSMIYEGEVIALTLINELGSFDIIERHTNFISAIEKKIVIHVLDNSEKEIPIEAGIVKVSRLGVEIFLGIEPLPNP